MRETSTVEVTAAPGVVRLILSRPPLNILTTTMMRELESALGTAAGDPTARAIVIAARGKAFSAGVDVGEHTREKVGTMIAAFHSLCRTLVEIDVPTIAAVAGPALGGGCELAALCDIVVAAESATIGQPEIRFGVFPPVAAAAFPLLLGRAGLGPVLLGEALPASRARQMGLVTEVVPDGAVEEAVQRIVGTLAGLSAAALRLTKRAAMAGFRRQFAEALDHAERVYLHELMNTADAHEGLEAFLAKRPPVWQHR
ncbi:MAG TPA: enoyl-CoA hydratase-related protein [bacterium]|nr:enoyl-CoA hydratase-related protein [bacterium]